MSCYRSKETLQLQKRKITQELRRVTEKDIYERVTIKLLNGYRNVKPRLQKGYKKLAEG